MIASTNAARVGASQSHDSRYSRWPSASRSCRLWPKKNSSCHQRRPGAHDLGGREVEHDRAQADAVHGSGVDDDALAALQPEREAHHGREEQAEVGAGRTRAPSSPSSAARDQFAVSELGRYSPAGTAALALPCATRRLSSAWEVSSRGSLGSLRPDSPAQTLIAGGPRWLRSCRRSSASTTTSSSPRTSSNGGCRRSTGRRARTSSGAASAS